MKNIKKDIKKSIKVKKDKKDLTKNFFNINIKLKKDIKKSIKVKKGVIR